jgi:zinc protease
MQGEFDRLGKTPVPADELAARKATLVGAYGRSLETTAGLARQVGELAVYGVDLGEIGRYVDRVQAVTPTQIEHYADRHLDPAGRHVVVVGDAAQFGAALRKAYPQSRQVDKNVLDLDSPSLQTSGAASP